VVVEARKRARSTLEWTQWAINRSPEYFFRLAMFNIKLFWGFETGKGQKTCAAMKTGELCLGAILCKAPHAAHKVLLTLLLPR
jgi:hypothetical protein